MEYPVLSVIIPVYNTEDYLEKCIDSVLNQSLSSIEIIVINDKSHGDTDSIMKKYASETKIKYHKFLKNKGLSAARNFGIQLAKGEYVIFCDSDDWVDLFLYEKMYKSILSTRAEIAVCGILKEFPSGQEPVIKAKFDNDIVLQNDMAFKVMTFQYQMGITITPAAYIKMVRKSFLIQNDISFLEGVYYEDLLYSFQLLIKAQKVVCVPAYYYHYLRRDNSIILSISQKHIDSFKKVFLEIKKFLILEGLYETYKCNYYSFGERFYNLIIRQIFEFEKDDKVKKELIEYSLESLKELIVLSEFFEYSSAEKIRKHLQPYIEDTRII